MVEILIDYRLIHVHSGEHLPVKRSFIVILSLNQIDSSLRTNDRFGQKAVNK